MLLKDSQWSATDHLVSVLKPYQLATTVVSGHKYVTMSLMLPIVTKLAADTKAQSQTVDSVVVKSFASSLYCTTTNFRTRTTFVLWACQAFRTDIYSYKSV